MNFPYPIHTLIITNRTNRSFEKRTETRFLVIRETESEADARRRYALINTTSDIGTNAHAFIDWKEVLLVLPADEVASAALHPANAFTYNIELCRASNQADFLKEWEIATQYAAKWCLDAGRDPYTVIRSHHEIAIEFGGMDGTDPDEYFASYGKSTNQFRAEVAAIVKEANDRMNREAAQKVIDLLAALTNATDDEAVRQAARYASDALREAAHLPKPL